MKSLVLLLIFCLAGFLLYPLAVQRTTSECRALRLETVPRGALRGTAPPSDAAPGLPAWALHGWRRPAGCAWLYWHRMLNPGD